MSQAVENKINEYLPIIAYAVGYDISDPVGADFIRGLAYAGAEDMTRSGVSEETMLSSKVVLSALIIFVNDNLNMASGKHVTSPMYIANVDKLRAVVVG